MNVEDMVEHKLGTRTEFDRRAANLANMPIMFKPGIDEETKRHALGRIMSLVWGFEIVPNEEEPSALFIEIQPRAFNYEITAYGGAITGVRPVENDDLKRTIEHQNELGEYVNLTRRFSGGSSATLKFYELNGK